MAAYTRPSGIICERTSAMTEVSAKVIRIGPEDRCHVFEKDGFFYATILGDAPKSRPSASKTTNTNVSDYETSDGSQWSGQVGECCKIPEAFPRSQKSAHTRRGWIYKLVNTVTDEAYVGQTQHEQLKKRMYGHKTAWRRMCKGHKGCRLLNESIMEHGWEAFRVEVLERPPLSELDTREDALIVLHGTLEPNGLNILSGANDKPMLRAAVRARRAKTMEAPEPRQRIADGVSTARKRCTPEEHAKWVENVRLAQTTTEFLELRSKNQKAARARKSPEELAEWNRKAADGMQARAAATREEKLMGMTKAEGKKWLAKLEATRKWRRKHKKVKTANGWQCLGKKVKGEQAQAW